MTASGSIILLNGASSGGKSTLGRAIQAGADGPFLRYSLDFFFDGDILPRRGEGEFAWSRVRPRLMTGYYGCVAGPMIKTWFTEGKDDPRISVIRVTPDEGYYWDNKHGDAVAGVKILVGSVIGKTLDDSIEGTLDV